MDVGGTVRGFEVVGGAAAPATTVGLPPASTVALVGGSLDAPGLVPSAPAQSSIGGGATRVEPLTPPSLAPAAAPAAARAGAATNTYVQALVAGTVQPNAQEQPLVDAIRAAMRQRAAPVPAPQPQAAPAAVAATGSETNAFEQRVLELVNAQRAAGGLAPVQYQRVLDGAASGHNAQQARTGTMAHEGIGDGTPGDRARAAGWTGSWGENVAVGQTTPEQVVAEWMASPGHRRNIMDPAYSQMGVSYTVDASGRPFWAQAFGG